MSSQRLSNIVSRNSICASHKDAGGIYRQGIKQNARPLERLKKRYKEFQDRPSSSVRIATTSSRPKGSSKTDVRRNALNSPSSSQPLSASRDPFSHMHAPPAPGRRPEKLRFNLSLLYTEEGVEYSMQESRARSMGLLEKKWGAPPASELSTNASSSSSTVRVDFNDDGSKTVKAVHRKSVGMRSEPTVTINTKEALADVFGMYNSPDKTLKIERPGSKHAPVKKFEPATPAPILRDPSKESVGDENAPTLKTPGELFSGVLSRIYLCSFAYVAFRPFVDENAMRKENSTPAPKVSRLFSHSSNAFNIHPVQTIRGLWTGDLRHSGCQPTCSIRQRTQCLYFHLSTPPKAHRKI